MMPRRLFSALAFTLFCSCLSPLSDAAPSFQGLWYRGESESGWGVNVAHQGDILFVTWFTYDADRRGMWVGGPALMPDPGQKFQGAAYIGERGRLWWRSH